MMQALSELADDTPMTPRTIAESAARLQQLGVLPEADGYREDGTPVFTTASIVGRLDVPLLWVDPEARKMIENMFSLGMIVDPEDLRGDVIHWKQ
ncbi:hypothetical protein [Dechloromonas denitrificans]|uniref:hypothetical protein n=1 Tax=Dechloromonas denitrificans TaxID=281362 RepID=UPI001CF8ABE3|nr:hypothetical protein [Dechloromonas denitrificans]UCV01736.1 hypothetical protein KI611_11440 [Dechloromonas denitrificans]